MGVFRANNFNGRQWGAMQSASHQTTIVNNYNFFGPSYGGHSPAPMPRMGGGFFGGIMGFLGGINLGIGLFNMFRPQPMMQQTMQSGGTVVNREFHFYNNNKPDEEIRAIVDGFLAVQSETRPQNDRQPQIITAHVPEEIIRANVPENTERPVEATPPNPT